MSDYSIRDSSGNILCHGSRGKRDMTARDKRALHTAWLNMLALVGQYEHDSGRVQCAITGDWLDVTSPATAGRLDTVDKGHVTADSTGGAYCPCNLIPETRALNLSHGADSLDVSTMVTRDARAAWFAAWSLTATKTKQARAVRPPDSI